MQPAGSGQFYVGYLSDAATIFEDAISRLNRYDPSQCNVADAKDMAHRIKGNAAMYGYPELGLKAAEAENLLTLETGESDFGVVLKSLIDLIVMIHDICPNDVKAELAGNPSYYAAEDTNGLDASQNASIHANRKTIIFAYQDALISEFVASVLEAEFNVICVNSGKAALQAIQTHAPDMIALEDNLGDVSALDIIREYKTLDLFKDIPVFVAFNTGSRELIAEAIGLGVAGYIEDKNNILEFTDFAKEHLKVDAKSILVVDDDQMVRELLAYTLTNSGYKVELTCDGIEAMEYLADQTPDLILLDRFMPRLEGRSVLHKIQSQDNLKSIPVLILTAMVNRGEAESWFERGAADFIPKPFNPAEVLMRVKQHLNMRQRAV